MPAELIPHDPEPDNGSQQKGRREQSELLSANDILALMAKLHKLLLTGMISPSVSNAILASFSQILAHYRHTESHSAGRPKIGPDLWAELRANPKLSNLLAGFLSDEELDALINVKSKREHNE